VDASPALVPGGTRGSREETQRFAAWWVEQMCQASFVERGTSRGWVDAGTREAIQTASLDWGEHSGADAAAMGVAGDGWLDG
jgi:hypothetical protein